MRYALSLAVLLVAGGLQAQYPLVHSLEIRLGQQRPSIVCLAQDTEGLLWVGSDIGLLRTDGERTVAILRSEREHVLALAPYGRGVVAAFSSGLVLGCTAMGCDTLLAEPELATFPVRAFAVADDGGLWLATHGAGLWYLHNADLVRFGTSNGLPDLNVNDAVAIANGSVVVATDQGLAHCTPNGVQEVYSEAQGAPDNLVLSLTSNTDGTVLAGTDRAGVFSWKPGGTGGRVAPLGSIWRHGAVTQLLQEQGRVWAATASGIVVKDVGSFAGSYSQPGQDAAKDVIVDRDGAVWWCTGTEFLYRAEPEVLVVPTHEGLDLRKITAICADAEDRIWFATPQGLFNHSAAFTEDASVQRIPVRVDPRTPIVSLAAQRNGTIWVATFGSGVKAIDTAGRVTSFTEADGLLNDNVLSVRCHENEVVVGTLDGVGRYDRGRFLRADQGGTGFVYDVLPLPSGRILVATDGNGIRTIEGGTTGSGSRDERGTYYSLVVDHLGRTWAAGPGTGLCAVAETGMECIGRSQDAFKADLFALGRWGERIVAFGSAGVSAFDLRTSAWMDVTAMLGLSGMEAELNAVCTDSRGGLWFACDKGLFRLDPRGKGSIMAVPVVITEVHLGSAAIDPLEHLETTHDRNDLSFNFSGIHYAEPGAVRFEYRLLGYDERLRTTAERQVSYAMLPPGDYTFQVRASLGQELPDHEPWTSWSFTVLPPWYGRPWVQFLVLVLSVGIVVIYVRSRERRMRLRQRLEQDRVRYQLEALRSQVDPHFLFNSFNTLVELIESEPHRAVGHVDRLSDFFRSMLTLRDKELITLREELALLNTYFGLEQERFGPAVELVLELPDAVMQHRVVPLTLQLLLENALKHNAATPLHPLRVEVSLKEGMVQVSNLRSPRMTKPRSTGFGLQSIRQRYADLDPRPMQVDVTEERFTVHIPLIPPGP